MPPPLVAGLARATDSWRPSPRAAAVALAVSSVLFASVAVLARSLTEGGMDPAAVALYRYALTAACTAPFLSVTGAHRRPTTWGLASGVGMGIGFTAYFRAVEVVDVASVGIVYMTYPLVVVVASWALFRDRPGTRGVVAGALVLVAATIGLGPGSIEAGDAGPLAVSFLAPLGFGIAVAALIHAMSALPPLARLAAASTGATLTLLPVVLARPAAEVLPQRPQDVLAVVAVGVGTSLVPMTLYAVAAPVAGAARTGAIGALELPALFAFGAIVYGESVTLGHLAAAGLIAVAVSLAPPGAAPATEDDQPLATSVHGPGV